MHRSLILSTGASQNLASNIHSTAQHSLQLHSKTTICSLVTELQPKHRSTCILHTDAAAAADGTTAISCRSLYVKRTAGCTILAGGSFSLALAGPLPSASPLSSFQCHRLHCIAHLHTHTCSLCLTAIRRHYVKIYACMQQTYVLLVAAATPIDC